MSRERKHERQGAREGEDMGAIDLPRSRGSSFVMTLWLELSSGQKEPEWRWRVIQVQTGERRYFHRLSDLLAYVSEQTGVPPPALSR